MAPRVVGLERRDRGGQFPSNDVASLRGRRRGTETLPPNTEHLLDVVLDLPDVARHDGLLDFNEVAPDLRLREADAGFKEGGAVHFELFQAGELFARGPGAGPQTSCRPSYAVQGPGTPGPPRSDASSRQIPRDAGLRHGDALETSTSTTRAVGCGLRHGRRTLSSSDRSATVSARDLAAFRMSLRRCPMNTHFFRSVSHTSEPPGAMARNAVLIKCRPAVET